MNYLSVGTINPRVLLFLGIVTRKCIFVKICVCTTRNLVFCIQSFYDQLILVIDSNFL